MSPAHARTSSAAIIVAARALLEDGGFDAVSMAGVAERVGVRAPSLYKHFGDRNGLLAAVATDAALELGRALSDALARSGVDARSRLQVLAAAYRSFALAKPRAAALIFAGVAPGTTPTPESQTEAARPVLQVAEAIVGPTNALAAARVLTAFAYGFASMESAGAFRFAGDVEEAYRLGISVLAAGLERVVADASTETTTPTSGGATA